MKLTYYIAFVAAAALVTGCGDKENKVQKPAKGPAIAGTNTVTKTTVTPAPPPPVTSAKPTTNLFPAGGSKETAPAKPATPAPDAKSTKTVTDAKAGPAGASAKVLMVNKEMKFVVLEFSNSTVPTAGSQLSLYRGKERVGMVKVTEPMKPPLVTADILDGEVRKGDEVR